MDNHNLIPCEFCDNLIEFENYENHLQTCQKYNYINIPITTNDNDNDILGFFENIQNIINNQSQQPNNNHSDPLNPDSNNNFNNNNNQSEIIDSNSNDSQNSQTSIIENNNISQNIFVIPLQNIHSNELENSEQNNDITINNNSDNLENLNNNISDSINQNSSSQQYNQEIENNNILNAQDNIIYQNLNNLLHNPIYRILLGIRQDQNINNILPSSLDNIQNHDNINSNNYQELLNLGNTIGNVEIGLSDIDKYAPILNEKIDIFCPIKQETIHKDIQKRKTICNHIFDKNKLEIWFEKSKKCPVCFVDLEDYFNQNP